MSKNININQYVASNSNNVEGTQGGIYNEIPDHSDVVKEREREGELSLSKSLNILKEYFTK